MKQPVFEGLATAIVTPFRNGTIDIPTFEKLLDAQLAANVDAIVICGTTGESATLSCNIPPDAARSLREPARTTRLTQST